MVHVFAGQVKVLQDKYNNEIFLSSGQHMRFWYLSHRQTVKAHNCPFKVSNLDIFPLLKADMDLHSFLSAWFQVTGHIIKKAGAWNYTSDLASWVSKM